MRRRIWVAYTRRCATFSSLLKATAMNIKELLQKHPSQWTDDDIQSATDEDTRHTREIADQSGNSEAYINGLEAGYSIATHYVLEMVRNYLS